MADDTKQQEQRPFDVALVEERLKNAKSIEDLTGPGGVLQLMFKGTIERLLKAEQEVHLGYAPYEKTDPAQTNSRNGYSNKTLKTSQGTVEIAVPRDREGTFEPKAVQKRQSFDPDLEKRVVSMYARGMSVRDIGQQLEEFYGTEVSPALISKITDRVLEGAQEWQSRPLEDVYAVVFLDAIHYKVRDQGRVTSKAAYTALGIDLTGRVDVLGIWIGEAEGAHFWLQVLTELKERGVSDILIACVDGLKGFPEAIATVFPQTLVQLCVVHQIRNSLRYVGWQNHKRFTSEIKEIYRAPSLEAAEAALERLEATWGERYPQAVKSWRANWSNLSTYFQFPVALRRMIYTTNAVEAVHRQFRKVTKTRGAFPTDDALRKMLYLATLDLARSLRAKQGWPQALGQLAIVFGDRVPKTAL